MDDKEMKIPLSENDRAMLKRSADLADRSMKQQAKHLIRWALSVRESDA